MSRRLRRQAVIKIKGDPGLIEKLITLIEPMIEGHTSSIMPCDYGNDMHAFITVFEVGAKK